jgi:hypothetical protein
MRRRLSTLDFLPAAFQVPVKGRSWGIFGGASCHHYDVSGPETFLIVSKALPDQALYTVSANGVSHPATYGEPEARGLGFAGLDEHHEIAPHHLVATVEHPPEFRRGLDPGGSGEAPFGNRIRAGFPEG